MERRPKHRKLDKMRQQRNMLQKKEQDKNTQEQLNEEETGNVPEKQFRVMIVKTIKNLRKRLEHRLRRYKKCLTRS